LHLQSDSKTGQYRPGEGSFCFPSIFFSLIRILYFDN
jgi:hypothetical protein